MNFPPLKILEPMEAQDTSLAREIEPIEIEDSTIDGEIEYVSKGDTLQIVSKNKIWSMKEVGKTLRSHEGWRVRIEFIDESL